MKKRQGASLIVFVFGITAILALASLVIDVGIILNCQNEVQKAVESAALVGASELEPQLNSDSTVSIDSSKIEDVITKTFNKMIQDNSLVKNAKIKFDSANDIKIKSKAVRVAASADIPTYFIKFVGIDKVTVNVKAAAISAPAYLSSKFPKNTGSIDKTNSNLRPPIVGNTSQNWDGSNWVYDNIYGYPDNKALSLGPGGYVTIILPAPLVDNVGADLYIKEIGNLKGYFVFAGNDDSGQIKWVNISCTGIPVGADQSGKVGAYYSNVNISGTTTSQAKFYGSGYFDLGLTCTNSGTNTYSGDLKSVKYLRIIDDNIEDGFMSDDPTQPVILAGDHSSITPGVNIDAVAILHHTMLINYNDLDKDTDGDGLIDVLENIIGTDINKVDTDNDGIDDATEYQGWYDNAGIKTGITSGSSSKMDMTNPLNPDNNTASIINVN